MTGHYIAACIFMEHLNLHRFVEEVVASHMTQAVKTVTRDVPMRELQTMFVADGFDAYPVRDNGHIVGLVTTLDVLNCFASSATSTVPRYGELMKRMTSDIMAPEFIYVSTSTRLTRVLQLMVEHRIRAIPVIDADQRLAGMISRMDVMRVLNRTAI